MSQFAVVVILPKGSDQGVAPSDDVLWQAMTPFDMSREVEGYERACPCVGRLARHRAHMQAAAEIGSYDEALRRSLVPVWERAAAVGGAEASKDMGGERANALWKEVAAPLDDRTAQLLEAHPLHDQPDPGCAICHGTGRYISHENPRGRWSTYEPGGVWNMHQRNGDAGALSNLEIGYVPFAVLTPDGSWHQAAETDVWGDPDPWGNLEEDYYPEWQRTWAQLRKDFATYPAVAVTGYIYPDRSYHQPVFTGSYGGAFPTQRTDTLWLLEIVRGWEGRLNDVVRTIGGRHEWAGMLLHLVLIGGMLHEADRALNHAKAELDRLESLPTTRSNGAGANAADHTPSARRARLGWYRSWLHEWQERRRQIPPDSTGSQEDVDDTQLLRIAEMLYHLTRVAEITQTRLEALTGRKPRQRKLAGSVPDETYLHSTQPNDTISFLGLLNHWRDLYQDGNSQSNTEWEMPDDVPFDGKPLFPRRQSIREFNWQGWKYLQFLTLGEMLTTRDRALHDILARTQRLEDANSPAHGTDKPSLGDRARGCFALLVVVGGGLIVLLVILSRL